MKEIKVKAKDESLLPIHFRQGEWWDLAVSEDVEMKKGDFKILDLGVCIEVPIGYEAILAPRSSTFKKFHIIQTNSIGVIDNAYSGDNDWWGFPAYATEDTFIPKGARIAQFKVISQQENFFITTVDKMNNEDRGGFGSTGL